MNILQRLLSRGSQTAPEIIKEVKDIVPRVSDDLVEVGPQVIGKGTKAAPVADEALEAAYKEITPTTGMDDMKWQNRIDPKLAKVVAALGLGGLGYGMIGGDEAPQGPIRPADVAAKEQAPEVATALPPSIKPSGVPSPAVASSAPESTPVESEVPEQQGPDFVKMLQDAQGQSASDRRDAMLLRAAEKLGAGLSRTKAEHGSSDILRENADQAINDTKALIGGHKEQQSYNKTQTDLADEDKLRDSNSDISSTARDIARKLGIQVSDKTSAKQLQDAGLPLGTLLSTKMAADSRREMASLMQGQKSQKQEKDLDEKQRRFARDLRKEATTGVLGKQYATFATGQRMQNSLEQFAQNPSGYKDYATLMGGLKSLQGDESVVREAEVRLGINATSAINKALNYAQSAMNGKQLQPEQRAEMIDTIKILTEASKNQYMQSVAPILEQASMEGIDPNIILSGSLSGAKAPESSDLTTSDSTRTFKSAQNPGSIVTVKSGKKYKIGADGVTGTEIP